MEFEFDLDYPQEKQYCDVCDSEYDNYAVHSKTKKHIKFETFRQKLDNGEIDLNHDEELKKPKKVKKEMTLEEKREHYRVVNNKFKARNAEKIKEKIKCSICGGSYTYFNKIPHCRTKQHQLCLVLIQEKKEDADNGLCNDVQYNVITSNN